MNTLCSLSRCTRPLLFVLLVIQACAIAPAFAESSRFERTVGALALSEDRELQARFASVALLELTETYLAEAGLARREAREAEDPKGLISWAGAVDRYAMQLLPLVEAVEAGAPLELRRNAREVASLTVEGRNIMLAHPRPEQQPVYELAVLERFCRGDTCSTLVETEPEPLALPPVPVNLSWEFGPGTAACVYRKLRVQFPGTANLERRKELCARLMRELETLAAELARQPGFGVAVDWENLQLSALSGRPGHLVSLNSFGDSVLVELPLLYASPDLLPAVTSWLRGRYNPAGPPVVELSAADYGWK